MGDVQGPQKVNNTCMKTMHAGTIEVSLYFLALLVSYHFLLVQFIKQK
jgi:hypothetical protein